MSTVTEFDPATHPHRRYNPLTEEYVLVSPHRARRPWQGQVEPPQSSSLPHYDPSCYLCPRNHRANGAENPDYPSTFVFENDFAALLPSPAPEAPEASHPLLQAKPVQGRCDVVIFHPRHDLTLARLKENEILNVIETWIKLYKERSEEGGIAYVQIFENKGAMMGCSNPHPHSQAWSLSEIPSLLVKELSSLSKYAEAPGKESNILSPDGRPCLLCDYAHHEAMQANGERVVAINDSFVAVVPWWAVWPFEVLLLPYKKHILSIYHLNDEEKRDLAHILLEVTILYDNLFSCSFAYSMGIHQLPILSDEHNPEFRIAHLHFHFLPPLLRSASVRKFLVGFELTAEPQRDLTPEQAAVRLRECSKVHYLAGLDSVD